jgi:hypothetical protein
MACSFLDEQLSRKVQNPRTPKQETRIFHRLILLKNAGACQTNPRNLARNPSHHGTYADSGNARPQRAASITQNVKPSAFLSELANVFAVCAWKSACTRPRVGLVTHGSMLFT